jgi:hypothetical protein
MMNIAKYFQIRATDRREVSSTFDHGDEVAIAALYLLVMMIMAVLIRLAFRLFMLRSLQRDDGIISLALVCISTCTLPSPLTRSLSPSL